MRSCHFIGRWLIVGLVAVLLSAQARAQQPIVAIDLNKLEPIDGACRAYLVIENKTDAAFAALKLDLVMFDTAGVVSKRLAIEMAPLTAGKTSLKVFDMDQLPCGEVGRVLLNDVIACGDGAGARDDCLALIAQSARGAVPFVK